MSRTAHFAMLGAPLKNMYRSWGAVRSDGAVLLFVWQDQTRRIEKENFVRITYEAVFQDKQDDFGYRERASHIARLLEGANGYLLFGVAKDTKAMPRNIREYDSEYLFPMGKLVNLDGDWWAQCLPKLSVVEYLKSIPKLTAS